MLAFLMPADVSRRFKLPPEFVGVGENVLGAYGSVRGRDGLAGENSSVRPAEAADWQALLGRLVSFRTFCRPPQ